MEFIKKIAERFDVKDMGKLHHFWESKLSMCIQGKYMGWSASVHQRDPAEIPDGKFEPRNHTSGSWSKVN